MTVTKITATSKATKKASRGKKRKAEASDDEEPVRFR